MCSIEATHGVVLASHKGEGAQGTAYVLCACLSTWASDFKSLEGVKIMKEASAELWQTLSGKAFSAEASLRQYGKDKMLETTLWINLGGGYTAAFSYRTMSKNADPQLSAVVLHDDHVISPAELTFDSAGDVVAWFKTMQTSIGRPNTTLTEESPWEAN